MANVNDSIQFKEFIAEQVFLEAHALLTDYPALHEHGKFKQILQASSEQVVLQFTSWCLAGRIPSNSTTETVEWPDGVWQTFKERYMPHWFVARWPVRMKERVITVTTNHYFVCPHIVEEPRDMHVKFMATGTPLAHEFRGRGY